MTEVIGLTIFSGFLLVAAACDFSKLRVPNVLTASFAAAGLAVAAGQGTDAVLMAAGIGLAVLFCGFLLFHFGVLGGGDGKLIAAASIWLGPAALADFAVLIALFGAGLAVLILLARRSLVAQVMLGATWMERLAAPRPPVPYAIAIAPAGITAFLRHSVHVI